MADAQGGACHETRSGVIEFEANGYPTDDTVTRAREEIDYQRAVQACIYVHPAAGFMQLRNDRDGAVALQRQIRITPLGKPKVAPALQIPAIVEPALVGVELFDRAEDLLKSAPDMSPIAAQLQAQARAG